MMIALLCTIVQGVWAWDGSGTSTDPYKIKNSADWKAAPSAAACSR